MSHNSNNINSKCESFCPQKLFLHMKCQNQGSLIALFGNSQERVSQWKGVPRRMLNSATPSLQVSQDLGFVLKMVTLVKVQ